MMEGFQHGHIIIVLNIPRKPHYVAYRVDIVWCPISSSIVRRDSQSVGFISTKRLIIFPLKPRAKVLSGQRAISVRYERMIRRS